MTDPTFHRVSQRHAAGLLDLLARLSANGDDRLFHPHPFTPEAVTSLSDPACRDEYHVAVSGDDGPIVAYGMLRGWEEGFSVPSLGIAVDPAARGLGLARRMMQHLHAVAADRGADRVRLTVYRSNPAAVSLYTSLGYQLEPLDTDRWLGIFHLSQDPPSATPRNRVIMKRTCPSLPIARRIPIAEPDLTGNEQDYVLEAVKSTWISSAGDFLRRFEREFADACETRFALGVNNGTTALHLALETLGLREGDEVLVPSMTYIATVNAVSYCRARPVFIDVHPDTWCIDPARLEAAITPRTKGIIPVHLLGHPADMDAINAVAARHGLWVVEDAAEAPFATYRGRTVGSLGQAATFSFFGNKILTSGEGGAVTFSDESLETRMRMLRGQGMDLERRYHFPIIGFNYRMTNVAAAILCGQMERREQMLARRRAIVRAYEDRLRDVPGIELRRDADDVITSPWLFSCLVDEAAFGRSRDELATLLAERGVETRPMFIPIHTLPPYRQLARRQRADLPETMRLGATGLMLPTYPQLADDDVDFICDVIAGAAGRVAPRPILQAVA